MPFGPDISDKKVRIMLDYANQAGREHLVLLREIGKLRLEMYKTVNYSEELGYAPSLKINWPKIISITADQTRDSAGGQQGTTSTAPASTVSEPNYRGNLIALLPGNLPVWGTGHYRD